MNTSYYLLILSLSGLKSISALHYSLSFLAKDITCLGNQQFCPKRAHCYPTAVETDTQSDTNLFNCDIYGEKYHFHNITCQPECHLYLITSFSQKSKINKEEHLLISTIIAITIVFISLVISKIGLDIMSVAVTIIISCLWGLLDKPVSWSSIEGITIS
jgi:hypothetical protein